MDMSLFLHSLFGPVAPGSNKTQIGDFDLPNLTDLIIYCLNGNDIPGQFVQCSNIESITCYQLPMERWEALTNLVCAQTWPKLKHLKLRVYPSCEDECVDTTESRLCPQEFFDNVGGDLVILPSAEQHCPHEAASPL